MTPQIRVGSLLRTKIEKGSIPSKENLSERIHYWYLYQLLVGVPVIRG